jgi:TRAP-type uncharacterized transport system substrate-binding protein
MSGKIWRWIVVLAFVASVLMALRLIGPAVPNEIRMLTGPEDSTFYADGLRYKEILSRHGVTVHLEETSGSVENLAGLREAEVPTAAYVWGLPDAADRGKPAPAGVESLGTMYLQPLWVFASRDADLNRLQDLSGAKIEAGEERSDSRLLALFLLEEEGIGDDVEFAQTDAVTPDQALGAIQSNQVAAIIAVGEPDSLLIDTLLRSPKLQVLSIRRADAFAIQYRALQPVRFPEGAHDLKANIPDHDLQLLAARAQLVVSESFPPALADLLLQAASEIHRGATPFSARGEFPSPETATLPLSWAADNFYTNGPPKLQRFLPFRLATWINRFLTAVVALASAAVAIFKLVPALIGLPFKMSIKRSYRELDALERSAAAGTDKKTLLDELAKLDQSTAAIAVPLGRLRTTWLELRQFIHDMRDRLEAL